VGITSFGYTSSKGEAPGIYTRVSAFVPWIEPVIWPNALVKAKAVGKDEAKDDVIGFGF